MCVFSVFKLTPSLSDWGTGRLVILLFPLFKSLVIAFLPVIHRYLLLAVCKVIASTIEPTPTWSILYNTLPLKLKFKLWSLKPDGTYLLKNSKSTAFPFAVAGVRPVIITHG